MGASAKRVMPVVTSDPAAYSAERAILNHLSKAGEIGFRDEEGSLVRVRRHGLEWVIFWGDEPGWKGDSLMMVRLLVNLGCCPT